MEEEAGEAPHAPAAGVEEDCPAPAPAAPLPTQEELMTVLRTALEKEGLDLPDGWQVQLLERKNATGPQQRFDKMYISPDGTRLNSVVRVKVYLLHAIAATADAAAGPLPPRRAARACVAAVAAAAGEHSDSLEGSREPRGGKRAATAEPRVGERKSSKTEVAAKAKAAEPALAEQDEVENEPLWHYRTPKGVVFGPFSLTELKSFRAGFERIKKLETTRVWRVGQDEDLDSVPLVDVLDGRVVWPPVE